MKAERKQYKIGCIIREGKRRTRMKAMNERKDVRKTFLNGIEDKIGSEITIEVIAGGKQFTYTQKLIGTDEEHLIFDAGKSSYYVLKNKVIHYN